jgi:kynurenine formamidase
MFMTTLSELTNKMECSTCLVLDKKCRSFDLSYPLDESTIFWPGGESFKLCLSCSTVEDGSSSYHYAAGVVSCSEHTGTHVDAPFHFNAEGITVESIPLSDLIAPGRVIDISVKCVSEEGKDYMLLVSDIKQHEELNGPLEEHTIVLIRTGWSRFWREGPGTYLGYDEKKDGPYDDSVSTLHFPGISQEAADYLISRRIAAVGIDTGST